MVESLHVDAHSVLLAAAVVGLLAPRDPVLVGEVGRLGAIEALVEAPVVAVREGDDELPRFLHCVGDGDRLSHQHRRCDHRVLVPQELGALAVEQRVLPLRQRLDPPGAVRRRRIPVLRRPKVHVVDRQQVHILHVDAEERAPHPEVEVAAEHAGDLALVDHAVEHGVELVEVPGIHVLREERAVHIRAVARRLAVAQVLPKGVLDGLVVLGHDVVAQRLGRVGVLLALRHLLELAHRLRLPLQ